MASKKKRPAPAASQFRPAPVTAPPPSVPDTDVASANRLGLYIALIGVVAVLIIGGGLVWLNLSQPSPGEPALLKGWIPGATNLCRGAPKFPTTKLGFSRAVAFSTSERLNKGLQLIEPNADGSLTNAKTYQDPSWTMGGYLGTFVPDNLGNVYVAPTPLISLIDNPPDKANIIYKVDTNSGVMSQFLQLPSAAPPSPENPFGILALSYDCDTNSLYVSSVMGSTRTNQVGRIYQVDLKSGQVVNKYENVDAFGLSTFNLTTGKRLFYGSARSPEIFSIALDGNGKFWGEPRLETILSGAYNKPRRIEFDTRGEMLVRGIDFNFTLSATSQDRTTDYVFGYDEPNTRWVRISP